MTSDLPGRVHKRREHGGPSPCPVLLRTAWLAWQISCAFTSANDSSWTSSLADNIEAGCGELYRRYSEDHTGCLAVRKDSSCRPLQEGLADSDRQMILDAHNMYRNKVASGGEAANGLPAAANMMQVVWNEELATLAQKLASMCSVRTDCADCRRVESFSVGQNICNYRIRSRTVPPMYWRSTIAFWYEGIKQFPKRAIDPYAYKPSYGTFTQMAWANTWALGCGYALFTRGRWFMQTYVCNYGPAGNYLGSRLYRAGDPCTRCPPGTRCLGNTTADEQVPLHSELCKLDSTDGPQVALPEGTIFYCNFHEPKLDCPIQEQPFGSFQVRRLAGGAGYLTTTVGASESAAVSLERTLMVPENETACGACCLRFRFRKGPYRAGAVGSSSLLVRLLVLNSNTLKTTVLTRQYPHWTPYSITLTKSTAVKLSLVLKVSSGSAPQYLDLTDFLLTRGQC